MTTKCTLSSPPSENTKQSTHWKVKKKQHQLQYLRRRIKEENGKKKKKKIEAETKTSDFGLREVVESAPLLYKKALVSVYRLTVEFENPARPNRTTFLGKHTQHL